MYHLICEEFNLITFNFIIWKLVVCFFFFGAADCKTLVYNDRCMSLCAGCATEYCGGSNKYEEFSASVKISIIKIRMMLKCKKKTFLVLHRWYVCIHTEETAGVFACMFLLN